MLTAADPLRRLTKRQRLEEPLQLLDHNDGKEDTVHAAKERRRVLQSRLRIGLNACIRALEEACRGSTIYETAGGPQPPTLLVLTDEAAGSSTSNTALHVLVAMAQQTRTPLLWLPISSKDLGQRLGTKHATALAFVPSRISDVAVSAEHQHLHAVVDSFVDYMRDKVPTTSK